MKKSILYILIVTCTLFCNSGLKQAQFSPAIDNFVSLYQTGNYDSIITLLRIYKPNLDTTPDSRIFLVTMLELFKEELGNIKSGQIGEMEKFVDTEKGSGYQVIYYTEFESGPGFIKFLFKEYNEKLVIDEYHFGSSLLGPEFNKKLQDRILSKQTQNKKP